MKYVSCVCHLSTRLNCFEILPTIGGAQGEEGVTPHLKPPPLTPGLLRSSGKNPTDYEEF